MKRPYTDKQNKKTIMYENIWRLVLTVLESNFEKFTIYTQEQRNKEDYTIMAKECIKFKNYINQSFIKVSNTFGSQTCPGIGDHWREIGNLKTYIKKLIKKE